MDKIQAVNDQNFDSEVLRGGKVVVNFWAEWCAPCKAMMTDYLQVAAKYAGRVKFVKLNVDDVPALPPRYHIRGIPTLVLFDNGRPVASHVGQIPAAEIEELLLKNF